MIYVLALFITQMAEVKDENGRKERFYLYYDGESVAGKVNVTLHRKTGEKPSSPLNKT